MNAAIYAGEYQRLEQQLDAIQLRLAQRQCRGHASCGDARAVDAEWGRVIRRLMQLDDLIAFDEDIASCSA